MDWKHGHKERCKEICYGIISSRFREEVKKMFGFYNKNDWHELMSIGKASENDMGIMMDKNVESEDVGFWLLSMSEAVKEFGGRDSEAIEYYRKLIGWCNSTKKHEREANSLVCMAGMLKRRNETGDVEEATKILLTVCKKMEHTECGGYALQSKAYTVLSQVAKNEGNKADAITYGEQAVVAAELCFDGDYGMKRDLCNALIALAQTRDYKEDDFEEGLLHKLTAAAQEIENEGGNHTSIHVIYAASMWADRYHATDRWEPCTGKCKEIMKLTENKKYHQMSIAINLGRRAGSMVLDMARKKLILMSREEVRSILDSHAFQGWEDGFEWIHLDVLKI
jgi:hypothetical protein